MKGKSVNMASSQSDQLSLLEIIFYLHIFVNWIMTLLVMQVRLGIQQQIFVNHCIRYWLTVWHAYKFWHKFLCKTNKLVLKWGVVMIPIDIHVAINDFKINITDQFTLWPAMDKWLSKKQIIKSSFHIIMQEKHLVINCKMLEWILFIPPTFVIRNFLPCCSAVHTFSSLITNEMWYFSWYYLLWLFIDIVVMGHLFWS